MNGTRINSSDNIDHGERETAANENGDHGDHLTFAKYTVTYARGRSRNFSEGFSLRAFVFSFVSSVIALGKLYCNLAEEKITSQSVTK